MSVKVSPKFQVVIPEDARKSLRGKKDRKFWMVVDSLELAHARHLEVPLITLDNDFAGIPGVKIVR